MQSCRGGGGGHKGWLAQADRATETAEKHGESFKV